VGGLQRTNTAHFHTLTCVCDVTLPHTQHDDVDAAGAEETSAATARHDPHHPPPHYRYAHVDESTATAPHCL
jgi:hypothetical protein